MNNDNPFADAAPATLPALSDTAAAGRAQRLASGSAALFGGIGGAITGVVLNLVAEPKGWKRPALFAAAGAALGLIISNLTWHITPKRDNAPRPESDVLIPHPNPTLSAPEALAPTPQPTVQLETAQLESSRAQVETQPASALRASL